MMCDTGYKRFFSQYANEEIQIHVFKALRYPRGSHRGIQIVTDDGYVYCNIRKGMYGIPQAGLFAQELLGQQLSKVGYSQSKFFPACGHIKQEKHASR